MKPEAVKKLVDAIYEAVKRNMFSPARDKILELEKRMDRLEQQVKDFSYKGVWQPDTDYAPNNAVTFKGGLWICKARTLRQPADNNHDWQLAVRAGRDARQ